MSAEHNHPPRCCCPVLVVAGPPKGLRECVMPDAHSPHSWIGSGPDPAYRMCGGVPLPADSACPSCPEHGDLATPYTEQETTNG